MSLQSIRGISQAGVLPSIVTVEKSTERDEEADQDGRCSRAGDVVWFFPEHSDRKTLPPTEGPSRCCYQLLAGFVDVKSEVCLVVGDLQMIKVRRKKHHWMRRGVIEQQVGTWR